MTVPSMAHDPLFSDAQKAEIKNLVAEALEDYFKNTGKSTLWWLVTTATIVGALTVIFGGFKMLLSWIGFSYIR